jgi:nicotinamidase-related amidase
MTRSPTSDTKAALLVVDLQRGMFNGERLPPIHAGEALLARVEALIAQARGAGIPVVFVRHGGGPGHLLESGTANWQIHPAIAPAAGEAIVEKHTPDSFHQTTLSAALAAVGARRLVVVGAQSEICVDTTCRRAFSLGFEVVLVSDAHSTWNNAVLTADQIIRHTNQTLAEWFVRLVSSQDAPFALSPR